MDFFKVVTPDRGFYVIIVHVYLNTTITSLFIVYPSLWYHSAPEYIGW